MNATRTRSKNSPASPRDSSTDPTIQAIAEWQRIKFLDHDENDEEITKRLDVWQEAFDSPVTSREGAIAKLSLVQEDADDDIGGQPLENSQCNAIGAVLEWLKGDHSEPDSEDPVIAAVARYREAFATWQMKKDEAVAKYEAEVAAGVPKMEAGRQCDDTSDFWGNKEFEAYCEVAQTEATTLAGLVAKLELFSWHRHYYGQNSKEFAGDTPLIDGCAEDAARLSGAGQSFVADLPVVSRD